MSEHGQTEIVTALKEVLARLERLETLESDVRKVLRVVENLGKQKGNPADGWLPLDKAAAYLGICKRTLSRYAHDRKISYMKANGVTSPLRFKLSVLEAFAQKNSVPARRPLY